MLPTTLLTLNIDLTGNITWVGASLCCGGPLSRIDTSTVLLGLTGIAVVSPPIIRQKIISYSPCIYVIFKSSTRTCAPYSLYSSQRTGYLFLDEGERGPLPETDSGSSNALE
jgi:hypothetical protein